MSETLSCRECGAEILFIRTKAGANMPVNAVPVAYWAGSDGGSVVYQRDGTRIPCRLEGNEAFMSGYGYLPHWGQCTGADKLRRPRERQETPLERSIREKVAAEKAEREAAMEKARQKTEEQRRITEARRAQCSLFEQEGYR